MPVRAVPAVSADVPLEIAAVGNVEAMDSVEVKSRIAGQINRVAFTEGQSVTRGELLFSIDRDAVERQALKNRQTSSVMPRSSYKRAPWSRAMRRQKNKAGRTPTSPGSSARWASFPDSA